MGSHIDTRQKSRKQKHVNEDTAARKRRASFKSYLRQLEEDLLDEELDGQDDDLDLEDDE